MIKRPVRIVRSLGASTPESPAAPVTTAIAPTATTQATQQPIIYTGQDPDNPSEKTSSLVDYLIDNKWWIAIAIAVAYIALRGEKQTQDQDQDQEED